MIEGLTLSTGATISTTGGTTQTFSASGQDINQGVEVIDTASATTNLLTAPKCQFRSRMPVRQSDGSYSKMKLTAAYVLPFVDSMGLIQYNLVRVEIEKHPETTSAHAAELLNKGSQLATDSDLTNFWATGSRR